MPRTPAAPCPRHGAAAESGCYWCQQATFGSVRDAIREHLRAYLHGRESGSLVEDFQIVGILRGTVVIDAEIGPTSGGPLKRRFLVNAHGVLEIE